jgi:hypothetical protein
MPLKLQQQELPTNHRDATWMFHPRDIHPDGKGPAFVATPAALEMFELRPIVQALIALRNKAIAQNGLDYLQVFEDYTKPCPLWFMENSDAVTALLPSDY